MEGALKLWAVILAVGAINYASRLSFIAFFARRTMPPLLARALRYVPPAMLMALIVPMVITPAAGIEAINPRIPAAIIAGAVAWRTRSTYGRDDVSRLYELTWTRSGQMLEWNRRRKGRTHVCWNISKSIAGTWASSTPRKCPIKRQSFPGITRFIYQ